MPITFPDNPKRQERVLELATDAQDYLQQGTQDWDTFKKLTATVNSQIVAIYEQAGLKPPGVRSVDILKQAGVAHEVADADTAVEVVEVLIDVAGVIGSVKWLAPAVVKGLVSSGAMTAETAAKVLTEFTIPVVGKEVTVVVGDVAGQLLGGLLSGIAVAGIDIGIGAIEGAVLKGKLDDALVKVFPIRANTRLYTDKSKTLVDSFLAVKTTLDAIAGAGIEITDQVIHNLIVKDVAPSVAAADAITPASVAAELKAFDAQRDSWTHEDPK